MDGIWYDFIVCIDFKFNFKINSGFSDIENELCKLEPVILDEEFKYNLKITSTYLIKILISRTSIG